MELKPFMRVRASELIVYPEEAHARVVFAMGRTVEAPVVDPYWGYLGNTRVPAPQGTRIALAEAVLAAHNKAAREAGREYDLTLKMLFRKNEDGTLYYSDFSTPVHPDDM